MAVDFSEFTQKTSAQSTDYIVGYDVNASGGEKKYTLSTIANAVSGIITPALVETPAFTGTFRNKLINGNFDIWQRGTSLTSGTGARYLADRFTNGSVTTTNTPSQQAFGVGQTDVPNQPDFFHRTVVSSGSVAGCNATLHQHIESVKTFAGKKVTLSFWAKATTAPENVAIEFHQYFGTGGSTAVSIPAGLFALTTSWQKFTVTANIPNIDGKTIGASNDDYLTVYFWFDAGANFAARASNIGYQSGTFDIAQVQLEEGSVATPFELRPIGTELALCQRYYEKSYLLETLPGTPKGTDQIGYGSTVGTTTGRTAGSVDNLGSLSTLTDFMVTKRAVPTIRIWSYVEGTLGCATISNVNFFVVAGNTSQRGFDIANTSGGPVADGQYIGYHWEATAEL